MREVWQVSEVQWRQTVDSNSDCSHSIVQGFMCLLYLLPRAIRLWPWRTRHQQRAGKGQPARAGERER